MGKHSAPFFLTVVLDGVGIGNQPDSYLYGDENANTLEHVCEAEQPELPNLGRLGLGNIAPLPGVKPMVEPAASWGKMRETSAGKDSTTGHWELSGIRLDHPFPTYPEGFPQDLLKSFTEAIGVEAILGGFPASGTEIISLLGDEHARTGFPIVYTSADSVFQIAVNTDIIPLETLYQWCTIARNTICVDDHSVGRVIARPFVGANGKYLRISGQRKDFSRLPDSPPVQSLLRENNIRTEAIGKISDLFGNVGFDAAYKTRSNQEGVDAILESFARFQRNPQPTFVWTNLVDFDQEYGHRNDPAGFAGALEMFDRALPGLLSSFPQTSSRLVITADHGNDPTTPGTDHSREYVPLLVYNPKQLSGSNLGVRSSFADHAASVADFFGVDFPYPGSSFLQDQEIHPRPGTE